MCRLMSVMIISCVAILISSCAFDLIHLKQIPTQLDMSASPNHPFLLEKEVKISLGTGYSSTLKPGTKWSFIGRIPYGAVYMTKDQVLTVEASNIYEAYIVVESGRLVGFYLPVERSFTPVSNTQILITKELDAE